MQDMKPPLKEFSRTVRWPSKHIVQGMAVVRSTRPRSLACIRRNSLGSESGCCSLDSFVEKPRSNYEKSNNRNGVDESTPNELNNPLNNATRAGIRNRSCERKKNISFSRKQLEAFLYVCQYSWGGHLNSVTLPFSEHMISHPNDVRYDHKQFRMT